MKVEDIRVFIPSKDYNISRLFYSELGFDLEEVNNDLTLFNSGNSTFFLQKYFNQAFADNLMFQLIVSDIEEAYNKISSVKCIEFKYEPVKNEPWGKVIYMWGPSGELWHVTQLNR